jgi:hypothetical protein
MVSESKEDSMSEKTTKAEAPKHTADSLRVAIGNLVNANQGKIVLVGKDHYATLVGTEYFCATLEPKKKDTSASAPKLTTDLNCVVKRLNLSKDQKAGVFESVQTTGSFSHNGRSYAPSAAGEWTLPKTEQKPNAKKPTGRTIKAIGYGTMLAKVANIIGAYVTKQRTLDGFTFGVKEMKS